MSAWLRWHLNNLAWQVWQAFNDPTPPRRW